MRHWNKSKTPSPQEKDLNFYPTYEALKHVEMGGFSYLNFQFLPYLWGIETNDSLVVIIPLFEDFYPTYEALKLL